MSSSEHAYKNHISVKVNRFLLLLLALAAAPLAQAAEWRDSLPAAQQVAAEQKKDLLILYYGDEFDKPAETPAELINSPHFRDEAERGFVLVALRAPVEKNARGEDVRETLLLFADATGRPYYVASPHWPWGLDWLHEELEIAAERRALVAAIWQEMAARPADVPEWTYARRLFDAMAVGIERFHEPYRALMEEAERQGDSSQSLRRARQKELEERCCALALELITGGLTPDALKAFEGKYAADLEKMPALRQALNMMGHTRELMAASMRGAEVVFSPEAARQMQHFYLGLMGEETGTRLARYALTQGVHLMRIPAVPMAVQGTYKEKPEEALATLDKLAPLDDSYSFRQVVALLRGRVLAELGRWEEARAELRRAVDFNPMNSNAEAAKKLHDSLILNKERLAELLPLRRRGDEELDAEWDGLLSFKFDSAFSMPTGLKLDLFYADEELLRSLSGSAEGEKLPEPGEDVPLLDEQTRSFSLNGTVVKLDQLREEDIVRAAEQGDAKAQMYMAVRSRFEKPGAEGEAEAARWMRLAAAQGHAVAQATLACYYAEGKGVEQDWAQAVSCFLSSAEQGYAYAQLRLAECYSVGVLGTSEPEKAFLWYSRAAAQEDVEGMGRLGMCYIFGEGVEEDVEQALHWLRKAALKGHAPSQYTLGALYGNGEKLELDLMQAEYWLRKAAAQGYAPAVEGLRQFEPEAESLDWSAESALEEE